MSKKKPKNGKNKSSPALAPSRSYEGIASVFSRLSLLLSLLSFAYGHATQNWLGLIGYKLGWFFHAFFGIGSYLLCLFIGWMGWRKLFNKSTNHLFGKTCFVLLMMLSLNMLLSVIEYRFPQMTSGLRGLFYPSLLKEKLKYHLGGALAYYWYADIPSYNLHRILGSLGVSLIYLCTLMASVIFLAKIHPIQILNSLKNRWNKLKESLPKLPVSTPNASIDPTSEDKPEQDPTRLVDLRIPSASTPAAPSTAAQPNPPPGLFAIQPETNLKVRPSISRKEVPSDLNGSVPFAGESRSQIKPALAIKETDKSPPLSKRETALAAKRSTMAIFRLTSSRKPC